ncbi:hypothetical protein V6N13_149627 [Hibiscus sabdariffa]|uniref:Uncharacterized protein n=1 Tax=Hibiscus sabdariffa TaxID=183260 RepID=A0ABR2EGU5_9ROSI
MGDIKQTSAAKIVEIQISITLVLMDSSALNQKSSFRARSNSLPSRPHPLIPQIDEHLCRLKSNGVATSSSSSITEKLNGLRDLQGCFVAGHGKYSAASIGFPKKKRRYVGFANEAKAYLASRKKANKFINKSLRDLKIRKCDAHNDVEATFTILKDVEGVTFAVLESLFHHITVSVPEPKSTNWSLVSKLMHPKRVTREGRASGNNEFERVNTMLCSLIGSKAKIEKAQVELQNLESSIRDVEGDVECLMRLLIKTRVSILNILSH